jgi:hypothetical protein
MKTIKKEIEKLVKKYGKKAIDEILSGNFKLIEIDQYTAEIILDDEYISIWVANGLESVDFYDGSANYDNAMTHILKKFYPIPENKKALVKEVLLNKQKLKEAEEGTKRKIEQTQLSNDLFFKFKGVYGDIKFTGYNDSDWWTKHKPSEIKEDENIIWTIDLEKQEAVYKPSK